MIEVFGKSGRGSDRVATAPGRFAAAARNGCNNIGWLRGRYGKAVVDCARGSAAIFRFCRYLQTSSSVALVQAFGFWTAGCSGAEWSGTFRGAESLVLVIPPSTQSIGRNKFHSLTEGEE
jgi:hypothetical protein